MSLWIYLILIMLYWFQTLALKVDLLLTEPEDEVTGKDTLGTIRKSIPQKDSVSMVEQSGPVLPPRDYSTEYSNVEIQMLLQKLQPRS